MSPFANKVAFITGGGGSIGSGIAKACLDRGIRVALADIDEVELERTARRLGHSSLMTVRVDVRDPDSWERAAEAVENQLGPVSLLFNNAGVTSTQAISKGGGIEALTFEEWRWTLGVNLDGVFLGLKTFIPRFKKMKERTHVVNTSSMAGLVPMRADGGAPLSYSASKAGVAHMTAQLRTDLHERGINTIGVSILYPGLTKSNIFAVSYKLSPGADLNAYKEEEGRRTFAQQGVEPEALGRFVLESVESGVFHIITHADWREKVLAYGEELRHSFAGSADENFVDPAVEVIDVTWADRWLDRKSKQD